MRTKRFFVVNVEKARSGPLVTAVSVSTNRKHIHFPKRGGFPSPTHSIQRIRGFRNLSEAINFLNSQHLFLDMISFSFCFFSRFFICHRIVSAIFTGSGTCLEGQKRYFLSDLDWTFLPSAFNQLHYLRALYALVVPSSFPF